MPEIKNQFTGGKMNKDVDERLVPKGEYRDAMNIQVSTSEGSEVGTVQNILGNIEGCSYELIPPSSFTVGSVADEKNDTLYWLVSGQYEGVGSVDWNQFSSVSDMIIRKTPTKCEWVLVDQYAFTTTNNTSNNFGSVNQISGLPVEVSSQIQPGWTVTGLTDGGDTSNTVEIVSVTPPTQHTANLGVPLVNVGGGFSVPLNNAGTMDATNNTLYLVDYNPSTDLNDLIGVNIALFDASHPDYQTNTVVSAQIVSFTFTQVLPFPQIGPSVTVSYIELTLQNNTTPFTGNFALLYPNSGNILSSSYNGSIIWGALANTPFGDIPIPNNFINHTMGAGVSVGDPILFGTTSGCIGAINTPNQFTLVDCSTGVPIAVPSVSFSFTLTTNHCTSQHKFKPKHSFPASRIISF